MQVMARVTDAFYTYAQATGGGGGGYGGLASTGWWWFWVAIAVLFFIWLFAWGTSSYRRSSTFTGAMPVDWTATSAQLDALQQQINRLEARLEALEGRRPPTV